jgi:putative inorganic carbon (hco3(-)) transporter
MLSLACGLGLAAAGAGLSLGSLFWALLGVVLLIPCDLPLAFGSFIIYTNEAYLAGVAAGLAWRLSRPGALRSEAWTAAWPLLPFLAVAGLSLLGAADRAAGIKQWLRWGEFALVFILARCAVSDRAQFDRLVKGLLVLVLTVSALGVAQHFLGAGWGAGWFPTAAPGADAMQGIRETRAYATFGHPNQFAGYLVLWLPLALVLFLMQEHWRGALGYGLLVLLPGAALVLTYSRGGWVGTGLAVALVLGIAFRRRPAKVGMVLLLLAAAGAGLFAAAPTLRQRVASLVRAGEDTAVTGRIGYQRTALAMVRERPWLGQGAGNYPGILERYAPQGSPERIYLGAHIHNLYAQIAIETGLLGLAAFLGFLGLTLFRLIRGVRRVPDPADRLVLWALLAGGIAFLFHNNFDVLTIYARGIHFALLLGLGLAFAAVTAATDGNGPAPG